MKCLVVVAHPDDETLWMGGLMIRHPRWEWHVLCLSRADDWDRAPRFRRVGKELGALFSISDLDDSPEPAPLSAGLSEIKDRIRRLQEREFDLVFTHSPCGEYTYHVRHRQVYQAVCEMVASEELTEEFVFFAYEDGGGAYPPRAAPDAQILVPLTTEEYVRKTHLIRDIYGFRKRSFEMRAAGTVEAFRTPADAATVARLRTTLENADS